MLPARLKRKAPSIKRAVRKSKEWQVAVEWTREKLGFQVSWEAAETVSWLLAKELPDLEAVALEAFELLRLSPDGFARPFWEDFGLKDFLPPEDMLATKDDWGRWIGDIAHAVGFPVHCSKAADQAYASKSKSAWLSVVNTLISLVGTGPRFMRGQLRYRLSPRREMGDSDPDLTVLEEGRLQEIFPRLQSRTSKLKAKLEESLAGKTLELKDLTTSLGFANPFWFSIEGPVATASRGELGALVDQVVDLRKHWEEMVGRHFLKVTDAGRPEGTGTFKDAADFRDKMRQAIEALRRQGRATTEESVASFFCQHSGFPNCDDRQLRRWLTGYGYENWQALLSGIQAAGR